MRARLACAALALATGVSCNEGLKPTPICPAGLVGICGVVTFRGRVPDSTAGVYIVAYATFPQRESDLLSFQPLVPQALPLPGDSTTHYAVGLPNGRYEWVVAAWRKQGTLNPDFSNADSLFQEAGFYRDDGDTTSHGSGIVVVNGGVVDSINIVVDFANMHPISFYFP